MAPSVPLDDYFFTFKQKQGGMQGILSQFC